ncbi:SprT-like domain-containing protein [Desertivirga xinjiangensis]|uniref:SprT-like domain-containing protein n=1 Tax=Desertivirga xinjiangensis TaxID=539206 RepID=UPI00210EFB90|nr:SprT-like domain-containing protein [Pedobacter xinjiangensis]
MDKVAILSKYIPAEAAPVIAKWIDYYKCDFKVSRNRNTKFGDYRSPHGGHHHRISVNYDLNSYAFLVTTVHEFAHLLTWNEHKGRVKPHGNEWKINFKKMMQPFFEKDIFPRDLKQVLQAYLENPAASSCSDMSLFRALKKYDENPGVLIESLPIKTVFQIKDGRVFARGEVLRKRIKCTETDTGRIYLFSPLAEVYPLKEA